MKTVAISRAVALQRTQQCGGNFSFAPADRCSNCGCIIFDDVLSKVWVISFEMIWRSMYKYYSFPWFDITSQVHLTYILQFIFFKGLNQLSYDCRFGGWEERVCHCNKIYAQRSRGHSRPPCSILAAAGDENIGHPCQPAEQNCPWDRSAAWITPWDISSKPNSTKRPSLFSSNHIPAAAKARSDHAKTQPSPCRLCNHPWTYTESAAEIDIEIDGCWISNYDCRCTILACLAIQITRLHVIRCADLEVSWALKWMVGYGTQLPSSTLSNCLTLHHLLAQQRAS